MSHSGGHGHYIIPASIYVRTFLTLLALTVLTVLVSFVHLGPLNIPVALLVAGAKAALVVSFFMGLKYDNRVNLFIAVSMVLFVGIFLLFTLLDMGTRTAFSDESGYVRSTQDVEMEESIVAEREARISELGMPPLTQADSTKMMGTMSPTEETSDASGVSSDTTAVMNPE